MVPSRTLSTLRCLLVMALLCLTIGYAGADSLVYQGETPITGSSFLSGAPYVNGLWDYVYDINGWAAFTDDDFPTQFHTRQWGILVGSPVATIWSPSGWSAQYYDSTPTSTDLPGLDGKPAVVWTYGLSGGGGFTGFGFQHVYGPTMLAYQGYATPTSGFSGDTYSVSTPEPGVIVLGSLFLLFGGVRRRWGRNAKQQSA